MAQGEPIRAPQFGKVKPKDYRLPGPRVEPWANVFAVVEGLGVVSVHQTRAEAETALAARRKPHQAEADDQHRPG
jgi:hypothetical protein